MKSRFVPTDDDEIQLDILRDAVRSWGQNLDCYDNFDGGDIAWEAVCRNHLRIIEAFHALSPDFHRCHTEIKNAFAPIENSPMGEVIDHFASAVRTVARERFGES
ncbi:MAG: hypothetical protein QGH39_08655 [Candidatus Thermoplasmatota archaeon]|jgi:hypothetical protein|nr:hypothetical protein [Candidatus Thermoplasmatota archaeon]MDP7265613.1 hypothetical protein [Candidatus Thermoplasmatota archaeon]